jgi:hypothetical protein
MSTGRAQSKRHQKDDFPADGYCKPADVQLGLSEPSKDAPQNAQDFRLRDESIPTVLFVSQAGI